MQFNIELSNQIIWPNLSIYSLDLKFEVQNIEKRLFKMGYFDVPCSKKRVFEMGVAFTFGQNENFTK